MDSTHLPFRYALVAIATPLLALGCSDEGRDEPDQPVQTNLVEPEPAKLPKPEPLLDREGLIVATWRAMTAAALGRDDAAAQSEFKGKRFELRMSFGCAGSDPKATSGWTYDAKKGALRVRVKADVEAEHMRTAGLLGSDYEGAVGFSLPRPWMLSDGCPDPKFATMGNGPSLALVQMFTDTDSRVQRPESSYETVVPVASDQIPAKGLTLVLSGRLEPLSDDRTIRCSVQIGSPVCVVSATIDRVAIVDPKRDVTLGEWGTS